MKLNEAYSAQNFVALYTTFQLQVFLIQF